MQVTRRRFLSVSSQGIAAAALSQFALRSQAAHTAASDPFLKLDGVGQAQAIKKGEATPGDLLEAAIKRIGRLNPKVNAVVTADFEGARSRASQNEFGGPFAGVPFLVKDLDDFAGIRTTNGARAMLGYVPEETEDYIQACADAGFNVMGKSNTPEFGLCATTESLALGPCYNPWDLTRSSGGSSGGAGAAVAAGLVPIAQGSDGGGSIRIPASCCGVFGLKPSRGRMIGSSDEFSFSVKGALTRSIRDSAYVLAHSERKQPAPGLRPVGLVENASRRRLKIALNVRGGRGEQPAADVSDAVLSTAELCEELGHEVSIARIALDGDQLMRDFLTLWASGAGQAVEALEKQFGRPMTHQDLEPLTLAFAEQHQNGGKEHVPAATSRLQAAAESVAEQMQAYDVVLSPVLSTPPPIIGEQAPTVPYDILFERMTNYVAYTPVYNVTGMPAMSVPLYWTKQGLPIGSQFAAKLGDEKTLLELAYELEEARPWADKWAPWSAGRVTA